MKVNGIQVTDKEYAKFNELLKKKYEVKKEKKNQILNFILAIMLSFCSVQLATIPYFLSMYGSFVLFRGRAAPFWLILTYCFAYLTHFMIKNSFKVMAEKKK